ncbi:MAG: type II toxin-antitoxin system RelE/ParE family toxin [Parvularcula sp.]|nr:type II toxin-antitoxin system RelE/ParE family toxin [Parvularcula sp.]
MTPSVTHGITKAVEIESIRHKALRRFAETGKAKGVIEPDRIRRMLAFVAAAESKADLATPPNFGLHALSGDREGTFAMTVTKNWRLTFTMIDEATIADLDLEDYH